MEKEQYGENVEKSLALAAADPYGRDAKRKLNLGNQAIIWREEHLIQSVFI